MLIGLAGMFLSYGLITVGYALQVGIVSNFVQQRFSLNCTTNTYKAIHDSSAWYSG